MGDYQARFCERLGVKFPLPTRFCETLCLIVWRLDTLLVFKIKLSEFLLQTMENLLKLAKEDLEIAQLLYKEKKYSLGLCLFVLLF